MGRPSGMEDGLLEESGAPSLPRGGDTGLEGASAPPRGRRGALAEEGAGDGPERRERGCRRPGKAGAYWMARRPDGRQAHGRGLGREAERVRARRRKRAKPPGACRGERPVRSPRLWRKAGMKPRALNGRRGILRRFRRRERGRGAAGDGEGTAVLRPHGPEGRAAGAGGTVQADRPSGPARAPGRRGAGRPDGADGREGCTQAAHRGRAGPGGAAGQPAV